MPKEFKFGRAVVALTLALGVAGTSMAAPTGFNTGLDAGWNAGSGQANTAFTEFDNGTLELGLRAQTRFSGAITVLDCAGRGG